MYHSLFSVIAFRRSIAGLSGAHLYDDLGTLNDSIRFSAMQLWQQRYPIIARGDQTQSVHDVVALHEIR
jgi:hypothetical protein